MSDPRLPPCPSNSIRIHIPPSHSNPHSWLQYNDFPNFARIFAKKFQFDNPDIQISLLLCSGVRQSLLQTWVEWDISRLHEYIQDPSQMLVQHSISKAMQLSLLSPSQLPQEPLEAYFTGISAVELQEKIREIVPGHTGEALARGVRTVELSNCTRYTEEYNYDKDERKDKELRFSGTSFDPEEDEEYNRENSIPPCPGVKVCRTKSACFVRCHMQTLERGYQLILALRRVNRRFEAYRLVDSDLSSSMCLEIQGISEKDLSPDCWRYRCKDIVTRRLQFDSRFVESMRSLHTAPFCCLKHRIECQLATSSDQEAQRRGRMPRARGKSSFAPRGSTMPRRYGSS